MFKAVIVDDEPKAIQGLTWELKSFNNEIEVVKTFTNPELALKYLEDSPPDCLFLDIQMPTMDGFQFLKKLKSRDYAVVITTAYDEYAIKALKHEAIDYLLKPVDLDDLRETIGKIRKFNSRIVNSDKLEQVLVNFNRNLNTKKITINTDGKLIFLESDSIVYVESEGNYSTVYLEDKSKILLTRKLKEVNTILPQDSFFRIHNSYIVNLDKIKEFYKSEGYIVLNNNKKIPVARQRKSDFLEKL